MREKKNETMMGFFADETIHWRRIHIRNVGNNVSRC